MKYLLTTIFFIIAVYRLSAQTCNTPGQSPSSAFPVCGIRTFKQTTVPICRSHSLAVPGCSGADYADKNPFWYKFTCYKTGTLGFLISPNNQSDDYDWQLYDITGRNPDEVFTDVSLVVTGNWAGTYGNTGASNSGVNFIQCASDPAENRNSFAKMPTIIEGHTYLLLVSHFTDSQSGYDLSFSGGSAEITDPNLPALLTAEAGCSGDLLRLKLSKKIKCLSLSINGSEFTLNSGAAVTSATGIGCSGRFDTDSIEIKLSTPLTPGNYTLTIQNGDDGNTLLDNCDNAISANTTIDFTVLPQLPVPMDSLQPPTCKAQSLRLVFQKPVLCSSIAPDGSDFLINGTYPVSISGAAGSCSAGTTKEIIVNLQAPLYQQGNFNIVLQRGTDGNTLLDECTKETPIGSALPFSVKDTVNAGFTYSKLYGCTADTVNFFHNGNNGVTEWKWSLDDNKTSTAQNPVAIYGVFDSKEISLLVSNGFCSDSSFQTVLLDNFIKADFTAFEDNCPNEAVTFTSAAQGNIIQHQWSFGDGATSDEISPSHVFTQPNVTTAYTVTYTVTDNIGCQNSIQKQVRVYSSCYLAVPNAFTPNNDGKNDFLRVLNAIKAENLEFKIFNRWGQEIFKTNNWKLGWDGKINGVMQASGVYVWFLKYTDRVTKEQRTLKGVATLVR
ncbi:MAG TPA: gliding motility-associated C-terminal domain-containing protein [Flavisolibacter sp.]|nr:gliding motility-associated C-terminal domain-containing protein [Flavisolibacter sp.]